MSTHETQTTNDKKKRRGGAFLKLGIAGLAILGIGGALTTAAWQGTVTFAGEASVADFEVAGRLDGITGVSLDMSSHFTNLMPNTQVDVPIALINSSTFDVDFGEAVIVVDGDTVGQFSVLEGGDPFTGATLAHPAELDLTIRLQVGGIDLGGNSAEVTVTFPVAPTGS